MPQAAARRCGSSPSRSRAWRSCTTTTTSWSIVKPVGVAAHPSPGLDRHHRHRRARRRRLPDLHLRRRRAAGHRAPAGRRHLRADGRRQVRARLHRAQAAVPGAHGRQALPRAGPGPPRPAQRHHRRPDRPPPAPRLQVGRHRRRQAVASPTTTSIEAFRAASCSTSSWRPAAPTRSGCTWPPTATPASATYLRRRPHARQAAEADPPVAARHAAGLRAPGGRPLGRVRERLPGRPAGALDTVRAESE